MAYNTLPNARMDLLSLFISSRGNVRNFCRLIELLSSQDVTPPVHWWQKISLPTLNEQFFSFLLFFLFSFLIAYDLWFFFLVVCSLLVWVFWVLSLPLSVFFYHRFLHTLPYSKFFYYIPHLLCSCYFYAISLCRIFFNFLPPSWYNTMVIFSILPCYPQSFSVRKRWYLLLGDFARAFVPAFLPAFMLACLLWTHLLILSYSTFCVRW